MEISQNPPTALPAASLKVLVVEDSHTAADILSLFFRMEGHTVSTAYLGDEAVRLARETLPDVAFLDLGLPDMSGFDVARQVRELPGGRRVFMVALTGRDEADDRQNIAEAEFDLHVVKPPEPGILRNVLKTAAARVWPG